MWPRGMIWRIARYVIIFEVGSQVGHFAAELANWLGI